MNLIINAAEAIDAQGEIHITTQYRQIERPMKLFDEIPVGHYTVLTISDNGSGIASEDVDRIFEPFFSKKVLGRSGSGIGLTVVWNSVQLHGAFIDVRSTDKGTRFEIFFPMIKESTSDQGEHPAINGVEGNSESILIIDDEELQRDLFDMILKSIGYQTISVPNGEAALEYVRTHTVDLLLLDMNMAPFMNGLETYKRILEIHPHQKAIIVSGLSETDDVRKTKQLGAGQYLRKPVTLETLAAAVKKELAG